MHTSVSRSLGWLAVVGLLAGLGAAFLYAPREVIRRRSVRATASSRSAPGTRP